MNILPLGMNGLEPINPKKKKKFIFTQIQKNILKNPKLDTFENDVDGSRKSVDIIFCFCGIISFPYILTYQLLCEIIKYLLFGCVRLKIK